MIKKREMANTVEEYHYDLLSEQFGRDFFEEIYIANGYKVLVPKMLLDYSQIDILSS